MEDEAEIYDGIRAQFPLAFGKQSKPQTSLEKVHDATRRSEQPPSTTTTTSTAASKTNDLPSLSSSPRAWLDSLRKPKASEAPKVGPPPPPEPPKAEEDDDDVMIGPPRPPQPVETEDDDGVVMIGPPRPPVASETDDEEEEEEEGENRYRIPMSNEIVLKGHTKVVSALAVDHSGSRVLSGSYDYTVRMYDFQGMNSRLQSFRQLEPFEGHQVPQLRRLVMLAWNRIKKDVICMAICTWRCLESLTMPSIANPPYLIEEIALNFKNFSELKVMGPFDALFASTIAKFLPNLKCTRSDEGFLRWYKYEEGLWKMDEARTLAKVLVFFVVGMRYCCLMTIVAVGIIYEAEKDKEEAYDLVSEMFLATRKACVKEFKDRFPNEDSSLLETIVLKNEKMPPNRD
ncbi:uncharacterized protein LOC116146134 [Pistacia vera]|uniref:uncharacterized protein LOC116146134 n=1 Tax=Pistacia vera TaxID=55513 RepID=UPI001263D1ED|nr:uncharacterized protein LOC116146134 [Pistacia vera]